MGNNLERFGRFFEVETGQDSELGHLVGRINLSLPEAAFQAAGIDPGQSESPNPAPARLVLETGKFDGDLGDPARFRPPRRGSPTAVPGRVDVLAVVRDAPVVLSPQKIGDEEVTGTPIGIGIEANGDGVILPEIGVPFREAGGDSVRIGIEIFKSEIDGRVVIENADDRPDRGGGAPVGLELDEIGKDRRLGPGALIENPVDADGGFDLESRRFPDRLPGRGRDRDKNHDRRQQKFFHPPIIPRFFDVWLPRARFLRQKKHA